MLVRGEHISGYLMMIHATFAPVFALCLAILAVTWAGGHRFTADDCPVGPAAAAAHDAAARPGRRQAVPCAVLGYKATFWLLMFLALPLILSIVISMFHILGTSWQYFTMAVHRWTGLVFVSWPSSTRTWRSERGYGTMPPERPREAGVVFW